MSKFIADTSVWSLFLRRSAHFQSPHKDVLRQGILEGDVQMLGVIRQECLSGIKERTQYYKLRDILEGFSDALATTNDHLLASEFYNACRAKGIQGSSTDFLICAQSIRLDLPILTTDNDFVHYSKTIPIRLIQPKVH